MRATRSSVPSSGRWPWLLALALLMGAGGVAAAEEGSALSGVSEFATPLTIVPPAFPANSTAPAGGVRVDIRGTVLANGQMDPESISAPDGFEAYVAAVTEVLKWWRFVPAADFDTCAAKAQAYSMAVWFEGSTASPKIDVAYPKAATKTDSIPSYESLSDVRINYPSRLLGTEGQVNVLMMIAISGEVTSVNVLSSTPYGVFDSAVLAGARRTTVRWKPPGPGKPACVRREYKFCLYDRHDGLRFPGCK